MKPGGRCGVIIKNTFLSNIDNASITLRKQLLEECNLFAVLDLPQGTFIGTGVKTVVLFFEKGKSTEKIWYYQLDIERNLGKTNPLNEEDFSEFIKNSKKKEDSKNSWFVDIGQINLETWDLTVKNPNIVEETDNRTAQEIIAEIEQLDIKAAEAIQKIKEFL